MITLVYVPYGGTTLADADVGGWAATVATGGSCVVLISQIGLVHPVIAAALKNGNPEEVQLLWDGKLLPVNKYGALHGRWPIGPDHDAAEEIMEHAVRLRKAEAAKPLTAISVEDLAALDEAIIHMMKDGFRIDAVKHVRKHVALGLKEACDYVDATYAGWLEDKA